MQIKIGNGKVVRVAGVGNAAVGIRYQFSAGQGIGLSVQKKALAMQMEGPEFKSSELMWELDTQHRYL